MPILTLAGEDFFYSLDGPPAAPILVLSNSLGTTMAMWDHQMEVLRQRYRILRYDTRGHGRSLASPAPYTLQMLGQDVLHLLDALKIDKFHFCGISMGGLTGLWLAIHAGARLQKLVIADSAARIGTADGWRARAQLVRDSGMAAVADGAAGRWFTPAFIAHAPGLVQQYVASLRTCSPAGYAACCLALADADLRSEIAAIKTQTLLIAGVHDPVTTTTDARFMQDAIGGAQYAELNASHLSNIEASADFNKLLLQFLA
ncbi:3-oxoadipate enol-lactonase [Collimonas pratensis]|uniref:3-oxoadipate enol-lactonase n=1 Tax=Collimonas pratensis TaxID=279113 RepID=A0ABN4M798_9BURK|nr:3-oxoadipate enol-lactonase [Collimonas pratensis]AMP12444.1 3-oxoadipate enol-lactonase [Collimonas pratensis]NKI70978.1 3-oxoadipate enol-lactonase [Collimonas pratensis]